MEDSYEILLPLAAAGLAKFRHSREYLTLQKEHQDNLALCKTKMDDCGQRFFLQYFSAMEKPWQEASQALYLQGMRDCVDFCVELDFRRIEKPPKGGFFHLSRGPKGSLEPLRNQWRARLPGPTRV